MWEAVEVSLCVTVLSMCLPHVLTFGYVTVFQSLLGILSTQPWLLLISSLPR